jgi:hypothetical protein
MAQTICCDAVTCLVRPPCELTPSGGSQKLWFVSICDIQSLTYESIQGVRRGRITGLALEPGRGLKTVDFDKKRVGLLSDSVFSRESNSTEHTVEIPLDYKDSLSRAIAQQMQQGEYFFIRLDRNGKYWAIGNADEGMELATNTNANGRLATDTNNRLLSFTLANDEDQIEVLLLDPLAVVPDEDLDARADYTGQQLALLDRVHALGHGVEEALARRHVARSVPAAHQPRAPSGDAAAEVEASR